MLILGPSPPLRVWRGRLLEMFISGNPEKCSYEDVGENVVLSNAIVEILNNRSGS